MLASVAFEAGIINGAFFTTLVLTAVLTSQFAGWWLGYVLRRGWPLLRDDVDDVVPQGARAFVAAEGDLAITDEQRAVREDDASPPPRI